MSMPQIAVLAIIALNFILNAVLDGKPKVGRYDVKYATIDTLVWLYLLTAGKFF